MNKLVNHSFVQRGDRSTLPPNPVDQVLGRSNVPPCRYLCIASLAQLLSEPFKRMTIWTVAQLLDT
jgi:hypothetical protein